MVRKHATDGSFENLVGHAREEWPLPGVVKLVLLIVSGKDLGPMSRDNRVLGVVDNDPLLAPILTSCNQLLGYIAGKAAENLVSGVVNQCSCLSQVSSPPFH